MNTYLNKTFIGYNSPLYYIAILLIVFLATQIGAVPYGLLLFMGAENNSNPVLFTMLLPFVVGLIALLICVQKIQHKPYLAIITGRERFDWSRFFFGVFIWGILSIIGFLISYFTSPEGSIQWQFDIRTFVPLFFISILLFPLQTAFEEILFRGYISQWAYYISRRVGVAFIVPVFLFALMHLANPEVLTFGWAAIPLYFIMAIIFGAITILDNGLELSIGAHCINNTLIALLITSKTSALQTAALFVDTTPSISYLDSVNMCIFGIVFIAILHAKYGILTNLKLFKHSK